MKRSHKRRVFSSQNRHRSFFPSSPSLCSFSAKNVTLANYLPRARHRTGPSGYGHRCRTYWARRASSERVSLFRAVFSILHSFLTLRAQQDRCRRKSNDPAESRSHPISWFIHTPIRYGCLSRSPRNPALFPLCGGEFPELRDTPRGLTSAEPKMGGIMI
jgi:hypothetical protein